MIICLTFYLKQLMKRFFSPYMISNSTIKTAQYKLSMPHPICGSGISHLTVPKKIQSSKLVKWDTLMMGQMGYPIWPVKPIPFSKPLSKIVIIGTQQSAFVMFRISNNKHWIKLELKLESNVLNYKSFLIKNKNRWSSKVQLIIIIRIIIIFNLTSWI